MPYPAHNYEQIILQEKAKELPTEVLLYELCNNRQHEFRELSIRYW